MKLIGSYTSPYTRKISVMLLEKQIAFEFVNDAPSDPNNHIARYNPLGKIPVLMTDDHRVFFDSPIVAAYLEQLNIAPLFFPTEPEQQLAVRQIEALADGMTDAAVLIVMEGRRAPEKQDENVIARQQGKVIRALDALEQLAAEKNHLNGEAMSLADIATVCALDYLTFRKIDDDWPVGRPHLHSLYQHFSARESFQRTTPR